MSLMELVYNSAKYSYFLLLLIAVPFFFEVDFYIENLVSESTGIFKCIL